MSLNKNIFPFKVFNQYLYYLYFLLSYEALIKKYSINTNLE